jgi:hypothetical protein
VSKATDEVSCAICAEKGTDVVAPPRRTIARGADPEDTAFAIIAVLPDVRLCVAHAAQLRDGKLLIGWCDEEQCRRFGRSAEASPCGAPYKALKG